MNTHLNEHTFVQFAILQQPRKSKKAPSKPQPTEQQLNQARQAAALALRNATMGKNDDEDEDDEEENDRRRHGRRGGNRPITFHICIHVLQFYSFVFLFLGNRHKNAAHKRNGHHHHNHRAQTKIAGTNNDAEQASGSTKR